MKFERLRVFCYERRGVWPFRRWDKTGEFDEYDGCGAFWESLERDNPALATKIRLNGRREFLVNWMIWGGAKRGRTIRFVYGEGEQ